jgi:hypothetical protein
MINLWVYLVRVFVFIQPVFWWYVWDQEMIIPTKYSETVILIGGISSMIVSTFKLSFEYYSTSLLVQYILLVVIAYIIFLTKYTIVDSLCIAFMLVYLNSFYWEIVLHFAEYTQNLMNLSLFINVRELWRLTPVFFFVWNWKYNKSYSLKLLRVGLIPSFIIAHLNLHVLTTSLGLKYPIIAPYIGGLRQFLFFLNRLIGLIILMKIVYAAKLDRSVKLYKRGIGFESDN